MLDIKLIPRIILNVNFDLQERLVNGQLGTVKCIHTDAESNVSKIYIKFDGSKAGLKRMNSDALENIICVCLLRKQKMISKLSQVNFFTSYKKNTISIDVGMGMYCA